MQSEVDDSLGYDILSYEQDGNPRYIEVKTTEHRSDNGELYFTIDKQPIIKKLEDPFKEDKIKLQPTLYLAHVKIKD